MMKLGKNYTVTSSTTHENEVEEDAVGVVLVFAVA
jgi:hypothetical protein